MKNANATTAVTTNEEVNNIIMHHLGSFQDNDLEGVTSDYTNESILVTPDATYTGTAQIKEFFSGLMTHFPIKGTSFELDKIVIEGQMVYIIWHASTPSLVVPLGSDTFIIKDGKIHQQTFVGQMHFINS